MDKLTIYINGDVTTISQGGQSMSFLFYPLREAIKAFAREGNEINNERINNWINK